MIYTLRHGRDSDSEFPHILFSNSHLLTAHSSQISSHINAHTNATTAPAPNTVALITVTGGAPFPFVLSTPLAPLLLFVVAFPCEDVEGAEDVEGTDDVEDEVARAVLMLSILVLVVVGMVSTLLPELDTLEGRLPMLLAMLLVMLLEALWVVVIVLFLLTLLGTTVSVVLPPGAADVVLSNEKTLT